MVFGRGRGRCSYRAGQGLRLLNILSAVTLWVNPTLAIKWIEVGQMRPRAPCLFFGGGITPDQGGVGRSSIWVVGVEEKSLWRDPHESLRCRFGSFGGIPAVREP